MALGNREPSSWTFLWVKAPFHFIYKSSLHRNLSGSESNEQTGISDKEEKETKINEPQMHTKHLTYTILWERMYVMFQGCLSPFDHVVMFRQFPVLWVPPPWSHQEICFPRDLSIRTKAWCLGSATEMLPDKSLIRKDEPQEGGDAWDPFAGKDDGRHI